MVFNACILMYVFHVCIPCMYAVYVFHVCIPCMYSMYVYYVCILCMYSMYSMYSMCVLYVCILCMYSMYVLYVCILCVFYTCILWAFSRPAGAFRAEQIIETPPANPRRSLFGNCFKSCFDPRSKGQKVKKQKVKRSKG